MAGSATFCTAVSASSNPSCCGKYEITLLRKSQRSSSVNTALSLPFTRTLPPSGFKSPASIFKSVVLPLPDSPVRKTSSPRPRQRDASCNTLTSRLPRRKRLQRPSALSSSMFCLPRKPAAERYGTDRHQKSRQHVDQRARVEIAGHFMHSATADQALCERKALCS